LFGYGSAIVCAGIFFLGVVILLPKIGIVIRFPTRRILALEIAFLSALPLLHLASGERELRALASLGRGGGQVGWVLCSLPMMLVGSTVTVIIYSLLLIISIAVVAGVKRDHVAHVLNALTDMLREYAD